VTDLPIEKIAARFKHKQVGEFLEAIGNGDITAGHLANAVNDLVPREEVPETHRSRLAKKEHSTTPGGFKILQGEDRDRLIEVEWGDDTEEGYVVEIAVEAYDRSGLLRDITSVLANEKINLNGVNTATDQHDGIARMRLTLEIADIGQLSRVLTKIGQLPNVVEARRKV
jgi:GTP pyrophosphokinase